MARDTARERHDQGRDETPEERSDRNWNELLQELRVMQTGTQILTGFLLTLPFQSRFTELDDFQVGTYLVLVGLAVATTIVVVAPVSLHRLLFRQHRKPETVSIGDRATRGAALAAAVVVALAVLVAWLAVPKGLARRHG